MAAARRRAGSRTPCMSQSIAPRSPFSSCDRNGLPLESVCSSAKSMTTKPSACTYIALRSIRTPLPLPSAVWCMTGGVHPRRAGKPTSSVSCLFVSSVHAARWEPGADVLTDHRSWYSRWPPRWLSAIIRLQLPARSYRPLRTLEQARAIRVQLERERLATANDPTGQPAESAKADVR